MDAVRTILSKAFYFEWAMLREYGTPSFGFAMPAGAWSRAESDFEPVATYWDDVFAFEAVQRVVNQDLDRFHGRRDVRERYHRTALRFLGRLYAQEVYFVTDGEPPSSADQLKTALQNMKVAWACPAYPCGARDPRSEFGNG